MPLQRCQIGGRKGWRWGQRGKCFVGTKARAMALRQARAILASGYRESVQNAKPTVGNPLKADPTRTTTIRRRFEQALSARFRRLKGKIWQLVAIEDAFGLKQPKPLVMAAGTNGAAVANTRWAFHTDQQKVRAFQRWLATQVEIDILAASPENPEDAYWAQYTEQAYQKGAGRAFDDTRAAQRATAWTPEEAAFYAGTKQEFLRSAFGRPVSVDKLKLLAGRTFTELKGITQAMETTITRELVDGLARGDNPSVTARRMIDQGIGTKVRGKQSRALTIARTETIAAHATGQLDALERLGVEEVGVMVEWSTAGDDRVCEACAAMGGVVFKVKEARGLIPRHPSCRCAYLPANIGESQKGQKRTKAEIQKSLDDSIRAEMPKRKKRTLAQQKDRTSWAGADRRIAKTRPKSPLEPEKPRPKAKPKAAKAQIKALRPAEPFSFGGAKIEEGARVSAANYRNVQRTVEKARKDVIARHPKLKDVKLNGIMIQGEELNELRAMGAWDPFTKEIAIHEQWGSKKWTALAKERSKYARRARKAGQPVANVAINLETILQHELGHAVESSLFTQAERAAIAREFKEASHMQIQVELSRYGASHPDEAVAEMFTLMVSGQRQTFTILPTAEKAIRRVLSP